MEANSISTSDPPTSQAACHSTPRSKAPNKRVGSILSSVQSFSPNPAKRQETDTQLEDNLVDEERQHRVTSDVSDAGACSATLVLTENSDTIESQSRDHNQSNIEAGSTHSSGGEQAEHPRNLEKDEPGASETGCLITDPTGSEYDSPGIAASISATDSSPNELNGIPEAESTESVLDRDNSALNSTIAQNYTSHIPEWYGARTFPELYNLERRSQVAATPSRPARVQVKASEVVAAYVEGDQEYNIWYHKYLSDRYDYTPAVREIAAHKCDPEVDSGYTKADTVSQSHQQYFCLYFAKGCCSSGADCQYRHRVPVEQDELVIEASRDVFGRERFGSHKDDMSGVGSFNDECQTIYVAGLRFNRAYPDGLEKLQVALRKEFSKWGNIVSLTVIPKKCIAFIKYATRLQAEFAKVAMSDQPMGIHSEILKIRWAYANKNARESDSTPATSTFTVNNDKQPLGIENASDFQDSLYGMSVNFYKRILSTFEDPHKVSPDVLQSAWNQACSASMSIYEASGGLEPHSDYTQDHLQDNLISLAAATSFSDYWKNEIPDYSSAGDTRRGYAGSTNESAAPSGASQASIGPITEEQSIDETQKQNVAAEMARMQSILDKLDGRKEGDAFSVTI